MITFKELFKLNRNMYHNDFSYITINTGFPDERRDNGRMDRMVTKYSKYKVEYFEHAYTGHWNVGLEET